MEISEQCSSTEKHVPMHVKVNMFKCIGTGLMIQRHNTTYNVYWDEGGLRISSNPVLLPIIQLHAWVHSGFKINIPHEGEQAP